MSRAILGVTLQLLSAFCAASGYVLQKRAHLRHAAATAAAASASADAATSSPSPDDDAPAPTSKAPAPGVVVHAALPPGTPPPPHRRPPPPPPSSVVWDWQWQLGLGFMVGSAGCAVGSAPLLPQSVQASLGAATIVFNCLLAALLLGEPFVVLDAAALTLIVGGTVLATATASASPDLTFAATLALLRDDVVVGYTSVLLPGMVVGAVAVEAAARTPRERWSGAQAAFMPLLPPALGGLCNNLLLYAVKVVTGVLFTGEGDAWRNPAFYAYWALGVCAVLGQVRWLNVGLAHFPATGVVPIFQTLIILGGSCAGVVYYHDLRGSPPQLGMLAAGAAVCVAGIGVLRWKAARQETMVAQTSSAAAAELDAAVASGARGVVVGNPLAPLSVRSGSSVGFGPSGAAVDGGEGGGDASVHAGGAGVSGGGSVASGRDLRIHVMRGGGAVGGDVDAGAPPSSPSPLLPPPAAPAPGAAGSDALAELRKRSAAVPGGGAAAVAAWGGLGTGRVGRRGTGGGASLPRAPIQPQWYDLPLTQAVGRALRGGRRAPQRESHGGGSGVPLALHEPSPHARHPHHGHPVDEAAAAPRHHDAYDGAPAAAHASGAYDDTLLEAALPLPPLPHGEGSDGPGLSGWR